MFGRLEHGSNLMVFQMLAIFLMRWIVYFEDELFELG